MLLQCDKLTIRDAVAADAEQLAKWWNDGEIMAHAGFPQGLSTTAEEIALSLNTDTDDTRRRLIIELDGAPIGEMNYRNRGGGTAEIGIKICQAAMQNRGLGKIVLSMLIRALFEDMGYTKIILDTNVKNERAQRVYERLGFKRLRVNVDAWNDQLGEPQSFIDYELKRDAFITFAGLT